MLEHHHKHMQLQNPTLKPFSFGLRPALAWTMILGFIFLVAAGLLLKAGSIFKFAFPVGSFGVAVFLHWKYPVLYTGFVWWLWFLTPWVTRLSEYQSQAFDETRLMVTASYLPILVILPKFLKKLPNARHLGTLPFVITFTGIFYGAVVGFVNGGSTEVLKALLNWLVPLLFGFHFYIQWRDFPAFQKNTQYVFTLGLLLMGIYGIFQYLTAPEWDKFWLINVIATGNLSFGTPEPLNIRVFSTMNSSGPYALYIGSGLLLLTSAQGVFQISASIVGYLNLLLSLVRSAWGGWMLGMLTIITSLKPRYQMRLILIILVLTLSVVPLATMEPFSNAISGRLETLSDLQNDGSAQARRSIFEERLYPALTNLVGEGIGKAPGVDSALLDFLLSLGWIGTLPYICGLVLAISQLFQTTSSISTPFLSAARAIVIGICLQLIFGSVMLAPSGVVLWAFIGLGLASNQYYAQQKVL
jgi:hypothetical protein